MSPRAIGALALAVALGGCGLSDPYQRRDAAAHSPTARARAPARGVMQRPSHAPSRPAATAMGALRAFARAWVNYQPGHARDHQRTLAALAVGPLRRVLLAPQATPDHAPGAQIASRGRVVMARVLGAAGTRSGLVVVEQTVAAGRRVPPGYYLYRAALIRTADGRWALRGWEHSDRPDAGGARSVVASRS